MSQNVDHMSAQPNYIFNTMTNKTAKVMVSQNKLQKNICLGNKFYWVIKKHPTKDYLLFLCSCLILCSVCNNVYAINRIRTLKTHIFTYAFLYFCISIFCILEFHTMPTCCKLIFMLLLC